MIDGKTVDIAQEIPSQTGILGLFSHRSNFCEVGIAWNIRTE
jgi:hypothetical protein